MSTVQYPWRTRLAWECRGYMYYVDVCESECLDVARAMWLTGADYISLYISRRDPITENNVSWRYMGTNGALRGSRVGGYSNP